MSTIFFKSNALFAHLFAELDCFIAYQLTPSLNNIQVSKRFDWLHEQLVEKFCKIIPIPPLPDKQISGFISNYLINTVFTKTYFEY